MDVRPPAADPAELADHSLVRPNPREEGGEIGTYAIRIEGSAAGRRQAVSSVEVVHDGASLWRVPTEVEREDASSGGSERSGGGLSRFDASVSALNFPLEFEFTLRLVLEDGTRVEIATVHGRRAPLHSEFQPQLQPLIITTSGRTGSTALTQLLGGHPQIVAYRPFQYEARVAGYWLNVLRALSEPASYLRQVHGEFAVNPQHSWRWIGRDAASGVATGRAPMLPGLVDGDIEHWMGTDGVSATVEFCQRRIDAFYVEVAEHFTRPDAVYFAEKYAPRSKVPSILSEIYDDSREVFLVRDFRDTAVSMLAWNVKLGLRGFGQGERSDSEFISTEMARTAAALTRSWEERSGHAHLVRYEDLILDGEATAERLLTYLGLDSGSAAIQAMARALESLDTTGHRTSASVGASIGRWRDDLSDELKQACERAFGPALEAFGYSVDGP